MTLAKKKRAALAAIPTLLLVWSCASPEAPLGEVESSPPPLGPADAGQPDGDASVSTLMCVATECPAPYLTCPSSDGATYTCAVDPRRDSKHCGGCGQACPAFPPLNMRSRCADGQCVLECVSLPRPDGIGETRTDYRNCNGVDDDGCETDTLLDEENCGICGHTCAEGQRCIRGQCGCPKGLSACGETCLDLQNDDSNCSECGRGCTEQESPCATVPEHTLYGCLVGECGKLKCTYGYADCDGDLDRGCASNGCETYVYDSVENCGGCGIQCEPGGTCRPSASGSKCFESCAKANLKTCPGGSCADTLSDPDNCGGCQLACDYGGPNTKSICEKGVCALRCSEGFGDCNGDPLDGCETNLGVHPGHCGACGNTCDLAAGQPCIEGKCLERPCKPSETK